MASHNKETIKDVELWRTVFLTTSSGRKVLADMLVELKFFDSAENEQDMVLQNYAKWLLYRLGIYIDDNIYSIIDRLSTIDYGKDGE